jgi:hypothetical protein
MIADLWRETQSTEAPSQIIDALTRYIQVAAGSDEKKSAWERIANVHRQQGDFRSFTNGHVQIAELPGADLDTISTSVNTFNSVSKHLDSGMRVTFAKRLAVAMESKIIGGDATDCSRLAWLLITCGNEDRATEIVETGLRIDPTNEHCQKLSLKLWMPRFVLARKSNDLEMLVKTAVNLARHAEFRFAEISDVANSFNLAASRSQITTESRRIMARQLANVMDGRIAEGNATDCSRLAWLFLHADECARALEIVERGLKLEPSNEHCSKLRSRLDPSRS